MMLPQHRLRTSKCKKDHDVSLAFINLPESQKTHITPDLKSFLKYIVNFLTLHVRSVIKDSVLKKERKTSMTPLVNFVFSSLSVLHPHLKEECLHILTVHVKNTFLKFKPFFLQKTILSIQIYFSLPDKLLVIIVKDLVS